MQTQRLAEGDSESWSSDSDLPPAPELKSNPSLAEERIPAGGLASLRNSGRPQGDPLVRVVGLSKRYLGTLALDDVSLTLYGGEIFGLVGPNGAGKSTLLRILATLTQPDNGEITICNYRHQQVKEIRAVVGFMPDVLGVYDDMLVREYFEFFARAMGLPEATRDFSIEETMRAVGIFERADDPVDGLSRGLKQRLCLGRTILHKPRLLLLDEPASGLDPLARLELRELLRGLQRQGATIVISSHVLEDLADICDRIGMVSSGRIVCVQDTRELIQDKGGRRLRLRAMGRDEELFRFLSAYKGVAEPRWDNESVVCRMEGASEADLAGLLKDIVLKGIPLISFQEEEPSLESAYLNVAGQQTR